MTIFLGNLSPGRPIFLGISSLPGGGEGRYYGGTDFLGHRCNALTIKTKLPFRNYSTSSKIQQKHIQDFCLLQDLQAKCGLFSHSSLNLIRRIYKEKLFSIFGYRQILVLSAHFLPLFTIRVPAN